MLHYGFSARRNDEAAITTETTAAVSSRARKQRAAAAATLALLAVAGMPRLAAAQGANHSAGNGGDAIRCSSGKPEIAIIACTHIIEDRREGVENRAIALRNRAFRHQQLGDFDAAIADYTTALDRPEQRGVQAKTRMNRGLMHFRRGDDADAMADYNEAVTLDPKLTSAYINRAAVFSKSGDDARAIADLRPWRRLESRDRRLYEGD
ncbi:MAG TPA: tetratricopeptide repeat protein [Steroidobacteraceae bacterium]|nr:tetratricopeptide repeat protein [Steroidobacteraceae bacterium]